MARRLDDPRLGPPFVLAIAFVATLLLATVLGAARAHLSHGTMLALMAACVLVLSWLSGWLSALGVAGMAWLNFNAFAIDREGTLTWHGKADLVRVAVLVGVGLGAAAARAFHIRLTGWGGVRT